MFRVVPRRTDERNTTSKSFEWTNCWNAWKIRDVWPPRNVQRHARAGKDLRHFVVRQPAAISNASFGERCDRFLRIANSVDLSVQLQVFYWFDEKLLQFSRALVVAPVADPNEIECVLDFG